MRPFLPGEQDPFLGARDEIPSVGIHGTITAVDTRNGVVSVQLGAGIGVRNDVRLPLFQFSYLGTRSSWFRFMPQRGDRVILEQNLDGTVSITGYECLNYRQLADADERGEFLFQPLEEGEFEIRSAGMARVFGSERGELVLAGGPCTVRLDRASMEAVYDAPLQKMTAVGCEVRFGVVKRQALPTDAEETAVSQGALREWRVVVARPVGTVDTKLADIAAGDVISDSAPFTPAMSESGLPLRMQVRVFDAAGLTEQFKAVVDNAGNLGITQAQMAVLAKLVGLVTSFQAQFKDFTLQPQDTIKLGGPGADEPVPLGTQLNAFLGALVDALASAVVATPMGPASFNPATVAALQNLKATYIDSKVMLSDVSMTQKAPTPGSG